MDRVCVAGAECGGVEAVAIDLGWPTLEANPSPPKPPAPHIGDAGADVCTGSPEAAPVKRHRDMYSHIVRLRKRDRKSGLNLPPVHAYTRADTLTGVRPRERD